MGPARGSSRGSALPAWSPNSAPGRAPVLAGGRALGAHGRGLLPETSWRRWDRGRGTLGCPTMVSPKPGHRGAGAGPGAAGGAPRSGAGWGGGWMELGVARAPLSLPRACVLLGWAWRRRLELRDVVVPLWGIGVPNGGAGGASQLFPPLKEGFVPCGPNTAFPKHAASFVLSCTPQSGLAVGSCRRWSCAGRGLQHTRLCRWPPAPASASLRALTVPKGPGFSPGGRESPAPPRSSLLKPPLRPPGAHGRGRRQPEPSPAGICMVPFLLG